MRFPELAQRHPNFRDALLWAIPALILGAVLRLLLLNYSPYAYWGSDSDSFFWFAKRLIFEGQISLPAKRQFLYPLFLFPVATLPGSTLMWLAWIQHLLGWVTTIAVAYCVRSIYAHWRWWIVPVTLFYAGMPILFWYEHELIGDSLFAIPLVWAFAGWVAWRKRPAASAPRAWWFCFVPFALSVLTKSAGRFFWPGLLVGFFLTRGWKRTTRLQWALMAVLLIVSWTMGEKSQGVRLLYTSAFPLTRLDTPLHAEFKAEIAPMVREAREKIDVYYMADDDAKEFLRRGWKKADDYPKWSALGKQGEAKLWKMVKDVALEGIVSKPHLFAYIGIQRFLVAIDPQAFRLQRFEDDYFANRLVDQYQEWVSDGTRGTDAFNNLFGLKRADPLPTEDMVNQMINPRPGGSAAETLAAYAGNFTAAFALFHQTRGPIGDFRPTLFGWWLLLSILCAFLPRHASTIGVWLLVALGYGLCVHLLGSSNPRFLLPCWPILAVALAAPADAFVRLVLKKALPRRAPEPTSPSVV